MAGKITNGSTWTINAADTIITGGNGVDVIDIRTYKNGVSGALVTHGYTIVAGNGSDTVYGSSFADVIWGDSSGSSTTSDNGADRLNGGGGNDEIHGGNGADIIAGDAGADNLWGDRGGDIFKYNFNADSSASGGSYNATTGDWVRDFRAADGDKLDFSTLHANGQFSGANAPDELQWSGTTASNYGIWYGNDGTNSYVYADTSGDGIADIAIKVSGIVNFAPGNFLGVNRAPVAADDVAAVDEDGSISATVAGNDSDPDGDTLSYSLVAPIAGLSLGSTGSYTFDASNPAYQHLKAGATQLVVATYSVSDGHGGSDTGTLTITVTGVNDAAAISGDTIGDVHEDGVGSASGSLEVDDVDDGEAVFRTGADLDGDYGDFTFDEVTGAWTYALDNTAAQGLGAGDTATDTLVVTSADGTDTETVTVTIHGVNDAAAISGDSSGDVHEDGVGSASGSLAVDDPDNGEEVFQAGADLDGDYGDFTFDEVTGAWTYTLDNNAAQGLGAGDTATDTLVVTSADGTDTETVTVTIHGVNDAAAISGDSSGDVHEDGVGSASGSLTVDDPDNGEEVFQAGADLDGDYGDFTFDEATGAWTYTLDNAAAQGLGADETTTDTLVVTSADGTDTEMVTVTIHGVNDAASIGGGDDGDVTEDGTLIATGTLTVDDLDGTDEENFQAGTFGGTYGTLVLLADGNWTYTLNNGDSDLGQLDSGDTDTETFTVLSADGTPHDIVVNVHGANETPPYVPPAVFTGGGDPNDFDSATGGVLYTTVANNDLNKINIMYGTSGNDVINGGSKNDTLYGHGGTDTVNGDGDDDTLYGGTGGDTIDGDNGVDAIYGGSGNDTIDGGQGTDTIFGGSGLDTIKGSEHADVIIGGYDADILTGDQGGDTFRYLSALDTGDTITDFESGDKIDLKAFAPSAWVGLLSAPGAVGANEVGYTSAGGITTIFADTDGVAGADLVVYLSNGYVPGAGDFVFA